MSIFNYKDLAAPIPYYPLEFVKDSNYYGQNFWLKKYTGLQHIDVSIEHGLYYGDYIPYSSYCKTVKKILTSSLVRKQVLEKLNKPVVTIGPYIHYVPYLLAGFLFATFIPIDNILPVAIMGLAFALLEYYRVNSTKGGETNEGI